MKNVMMENDEVALRHQIHAHPELGFNEHQTADLVAGVLTELGYDVDRQIADTGVVGTLRRKGGMNVIGLRADMDALPIAENSELPYRSRVDNVMHACGHDGHTATLLRAARLLARSEVLSGTVHLIFQPAEEGLGGARRMIEEGLFDRYPCDAVFGFHNIPGLPLGQFCLLDGPAMASSDRARIVVRGVGGHGASPDQAIDAVAASAAIVSALQTIVSRNISPFEAAVVTVASINGGQGYNIIPDSVELKLTIRTYNEDVRAMIKERISSLARCQAESFGASASVEFDSIHPVLVNDANHNKIAKEIVEELFGVAQISERKVPFSYSEDFAFMLERCSGSYFFIGNGDSHGLHHPNYDFNDALIDIGARFWCRLVERYLA